MQVSFDDVRPDAFNRSGFNADARFRAGELGLGTKVLLVTGGSRGIGAATALLAARRGCAVAVNYASNSLAADEVVRASAPTAARAITVQADVGDEAQVLAMFEQVDAKLGRLTALVNNAGVVDVQARVDEMSVARLERMFRINVIGSFVCAREAVRRMSTRHGGSGGAIVNLSSAAARLGSPGQYVDYAASKGAIDSFTIGLAKEVAAEGIRVNAVRPGPDRHRHPCLGRHARPRPRPRAHRADAAHRHRAEEVADGHRLAAVGRGELHHGDLPRRDGRTLMATPTMDLIKPLVTLLAIVNPLAIVPFFIHYTQGYTDAQRQRTAWCRPSAPSW